MYTPSTEYQQQNNVYLLAEAGDHKGAGLP